MKSTTTLHTILFLSIVSINSCNTSKIQKESIENRENILNKDIKTNNLNGKVKYVDEYILNLETNEKMDSFIKGFNEKGILILSKNDFIRFTDFIEIKCDSKGLPISGTRVTEGMNNEKQIYSYVYKCNTNGLITEKKVEMDLFESVDYIKYNNDGFETSKRTFKSGICTSIDTTVYDAQNRKILFAHLDSKTLKPTYEVLTVYSDKSKETIETWYSNGNSTRINKNIDRLDNFNNPISRIMINDGDTSSTWSFNYTYDNKNNWIERIGYKGKVIVSKWKRDITYY